MCIDQKHYYHISTKGLEVDLFKDEEDFRQTLEKCREVTPETIKGEKMFYKVIGQVVKFLSPLM